MSEQYAVLETQAKLSTDHLIEACRRGFGIACLDSGEKEELLRPFEEWYTDTFSSDIPPGTSIERPGSSVTKRDKAKDGFVVDIVKYWGVDDRSIPIAIGDTNEEV